MQKRKYSKYVKTLEFKEKRPDFYRQGIKLGPDFFGFDIQLELGTYIAPGKMGRNPGKPHIHNFDQVMIWFGVDTDDMGDLDAEIEVCLGENLDRVMVTTSTAVFVPGGLPTTLPQYTGWTKNPYIWRYHTQKNTLKRYLRLIRDPEIIPLSCQKPST